MKLTPTFYAALGLSILGALGFLIFGSQEELLWFVVGSGLTLINFYVAILALKFGFKNNVSRVIFLGIVFLKTFVYLGIVGLLIALVKPLVLPFTLGISVVIVGAVLAAIVESRRLLSDSGAEG